MGFWTLKSSQQVAQEEYEKKRTEQRLANSTTLDDVFSARRKEAEEFENRVRDFLSDISSIFTRAGVGDYTTRALGHYAKLDEVEEGKRRIGMRWKNSASGMDVELKFAFLETTTMCEGDRRIRIEFTGLTTADTLDHNNPLVREDINDKYSIANREVYKYTSMLKDEFRSTRMFDTYADFEKANFVPPAWFTAMLREHIPLG